mmetsp:Transcript_19755/g.64218  ORF Transcript_19755/g.64218 Transcript_19755/m.64218 type:complete len:312 (+) Transcript_19755:2-937(+)
MSIIGAKHGEQGGDLGDGTYDEPEPYKPKKWGTERDHPSRTRRPEGTPVPMKSLNAPRSADAIAAGFGPGNAGKFGEGGNTQRLSGPLSGDVSDNPAYRHLRTEHHAQLKDHAEGEERVSHPSAAAKVPGPELVTGGDGQEDRMLRGNAFVPYDQQSGPALQQDRVDVPEAVTLERLGSVENHFMTQAERDQEDADMDACIDAYRKRFSELKAQGVKRPGATKIKVKPGAETDERREHEVPQAELLGDYKKHLASRSDEDASLKQSLAWRRRRTEDERKNEAIDSQKHYMQMRGLEFDEDGQMAPKERPEE